MDEPQFLVNDFLLQSQEELSHVAAVANRTLDPVVNRRALFLKEFMYGAFLASQKKLVKRAHPEKAALEARKAELLAQLSSLSAPQMVETVAHPVAALPPLDDIPEP